jgi:hypothetical protein
MILKIELGRDAQNQFSQFNPAGSTTLLSSGESIVEICRTNFSHIKVPKHLPPTLSGGKGWLFQRRGKSILLLSYGIEKNDF